MDLLNFTEYFKSNSLVLLLTLAATMIGSAWINYLYPKAQKRGSLSFPEEIVTRSNLRKRFLFPALLICFYKAWNQLSCPELCYILTAIAILLYFTVTDFEQHVILDEMLLVFAIFGFCYALHLHLPILNRIFASLTGGLFFLILAIISKGAIGGGDIKLIAALGLWLGVKSLLSIIVYGAMAGGIAALVLLLFKKIKRNQYLAYGPYFALSAIGVLLKWLRILF